MKKSLLSTLVLASATMLAQLPVGTAPQNKKAVLEEFTGIHCGYCPDGHRIASQIHDNDPNNVVLINIHSGSFANANPGEPDFKTPEGTAIDGMSGMGITGYPAGSMNREVLVGSVMATGRSSWTSMANTIKSQPAYCNVALQGTLNPQTRVLTVDVEVYYTGSSPVSTNSLNVFLLEDKIAGPQSNYGNPLYNIENYNANGTYNHNHVLRKALTPTFGLTIPNTSATSLFTTQLTYTLPATYGAGGKTTIPNLGNLELAAFVSQTDRKIINASYGPISLSNDAKAVSATLPSFVCGTVVNANVTVENTGLTAITDLTITPYIDGVVGNTTSWTGNLAPGASTSIALNALTTSGGGGHLFTYNITGVSNGDFFTDNNIAKTNFYAATDYQADPVSEGFAKSIFPPANWGIVNSDNGSSWTRVTGSGAYNLSSQCSKYDFFNNTVIGDMDELLLPPMDLDGSADPILYFDVAYAQRNVNSDDALDVFVSIDCGATWVNVYNAHGANLTNSGPTAVAYTPSQSDPTEWRSEQVVLTGYNKANVLVKFVATSDNGNNLYLDNVNLSQSSPTGISKINSTGVSVLVYPNPSNGLTNLSINALNGSGAKVTVVNMLGEVVYTKDLNLSIGSNNLQIDTQDYASGVYTIVINSAKGTTVKKLNVTK